MSRRHRPVSTASSEEAQEADDINTCSRCLLPMDPLLAERENWRTHPSCDPRHRVPPPAHHGHFVLDQTPFGRRRTP